MKLSSVISDENRICIYYYKMCMDGIVKDKKLVDIITGSKTTKK